MGVAQVSSPSDLAVCFRLSTAEIYYHMYSKSTELFRFPLYCTRDGSTSRGVWYCQVMSHKCELPAVTVTFDLEEVRRLTGCPVTWHLKFEVLRAGTHNSTAPKAAVHQGEPVL